MKKIIFSRKYLVAVLFLAVGIANAQYKNKASLVSDLNDTSGFTMNAKQKKDFDSLNNKMIADLAKNDKSSKSKAEKDKEVDRIFDQNDKQMDRLFGNDENYKKNNKNFKQKRRGIKTKVKLAKLIF